MILIITFEDNEHVERVRTHLKRDVVCLDMAWFPSRMQADVRLTDDFEGMCLRLPDGSALMLDQIGAVWRRRIRPMELHPEVQDETSRLFAWSECEEAFQGMCQSIDCFWMNPIAADEAAQRKILQLRVARQVDLSIPETHITNDPEAARDFVLRHGPENVIRKAFRNIEQAPRQTSVLTEDDLSVIDSVRFAPVTFQRYVPADLDLRITVVEDDVFAASIRSPEKYHADYRTGLGEATVEPYDLPAAAQENLLQLMRRLDLQYGAIDMRVTPDGEHVFLEVNPAGEYLFIEDRTQQPIAAAIAASLDRHDQACS